MSSVVSPPRPAPSRSNPVIAGGVALAVAAVAVLLLLVSRLGSPGQVETITVANGTPYNVEVAVGKPDSTRRVSLGTVRREASGVFEGVLDQGKRWVFQFSYGGSDAGAVTLDGESLRAAHFVVDVPTAVADRLRSLGFAPSSPSQ